jgi:phosphatidylglycerophosphate synthase
MTNEAGARRPIEARRKPWARSLAGLLTRWGASPNAISISSVFAAAGAGAAILGFRQCDHRAVQIALLLAAAACIQLRLICNLMDGMVAVEGGRRSKTGEIYNDLPDRISDTLIIVPFGYAIPSAHGWAPELGWLAALLAMFTAYVRMLGDASGTAQYFLGPMAKPQRMAVLTVACAAATVEIYAGWRGWVFLAALLLIVAGSGATAVRRLSRIAGEMESR